MSRPFISTHCSCGARGVVLFHDEFWCGRCADVLLEDSPAHEFARMEEAPERPKIVAGSIR